MVCVIFFFFFLKRGSCGKLAVTLVLSLVNLSRLSKTELFIEYVLQKKATAEIQLQCSQLFCVFLMPKELIRKLEETMLN